LPCAPFQTGFVGDKNLALGFAVQCRTVSHAKRYERVTAHHFPPLSAGLDSSVTHPCASARKLSDGLRRPVLSDRQLTTRASASREQGAQADNLLNSHHGKDTPSIRPLEAAVLVRRRGATRPNRRTVFARRTHSARRPFRGRCPDPAPRRGDGTHGALTASALCKQC